MNAKQNLDANSNIVSQQNFTSSHMCTGNFQKDIIEHKYQLAYVDAQHNYADVVLGIHSLSSNASNIPVALFESSMLCKSILDFLWKM